MKVFKFGGASVKDANAISNMVSIVQSYDGPLFIVVSAIGKTTNAMEKLWTAYVHQDQTGVTESLKTLHTFHHEIIESLDGEGQRQCLEIFQQSFTQLEQYLTKEPSDNIAFEYDQIVSYGELWSTIIVCGFLSFSGVDSMNLDARKLIRTSNHFQEGRVDWNKTQELVLKEVEAARQFWRYDHRTLDPNQPKCLITQGFIGHTNNGLTTTLGREGSDFTAAILGWALDAEEVLIWKDVSGLLNADPKKFTHTVKIDQISYREAIELSYFGASIIHPKTLKPLQNKNIPLKIKSFVDPDAQGTMIHSDERFDDHQSSYILTNNQMLMTISPTDFSFIMEDHISVIFKVFAKHGVKVHLMQNSALNFSVCMNVKPHKCGELIAELSDNFLVRYNDNVDLFTVRHYQGLDLPEPLKDKTVLLQQRSRSTLRYVLR